MCQFVPNFLSSVSVKYYLNWFTVKKLIAKMKRINLLLRHSVYYNTSCTPNLYALLNTSSEKLSEAVNQFH